MFQAFKYSLVFLSVFLISSCAKKDGFLENEVTVAEVNRDFQYMVDTTRMPFTSKCLSICYYFRSGGLQDMTMLCKFSCSMNQVDGILNSMYAWNSKQISPGSTRSDKSTLPFSIEMIPKVEASKLSWWDLDASRIIRESLCPTKFGCNIWVVDMGADQAAVYMYQSQ